MSKTKKMASTAILIAMYFILSALIKIPIAGHIALDLGYIALTVSAVYLGGICTMCVGGISVLLESALMTTKDNKELILSALIIVPLSMLVGVATKTLIDCLLYNLPLAAKIPTGLAAWALDSIVMLALGLPLSITLKKYGLKL